MWQIKFACHKTPIWVFKTFPQTKNIKMKNIYIYVVRVQRKLDVIWFCWNDLTIWLKNSPDVKIIFLFQCCRWVAKSDLCSYWVRTFLIKHWLVIKLTIEENRTAVFLVLQNLGNVINVFCFVWPVCSKSVQHG